MTQTVDLDAFVERARQAASAADPERALFGDG
mgnify:CR=1 FL=1